MAQWTKSADGTLNGTTPVTIVAAPGASTSRDVRFVNIYNADTAAVTIALRYLNTAATRVLWKITLQPGESVKDETLPVLDTVNKSITAIMSGAPATTQPDFVATYGDET
jgi:hypothetical protein